MVQVSDRQLNNRLEPMSRERFRQALFRNGCNPFPGFVVLSTDTPWKRQTPREAKTCHGE